MWKCDKSNHSHQIMVMLKITFKQFLMSLIEAYNIVERRVKLNSKMLLHRKILILLAGNIGLIKY